METSGFLAQVFWNIYNLDWGERIDLKTVLTGL